MIFSRFADLKAMLDSNKDTLKVDAMKRIITARIILVSLPMIENGKKLKCRGPTEYAPSLSSPKNA